MEAPSLRSALIIGYGSIGRRHHDVLKTLCPSARLSVVSRHVEASGDFFPSLDRVPDIAAFDYYVIASKTLEHYGNLKTIDGLVADKRILVEKPLFDTPRDFPVSRNRIYVGYNLRFHPILRKLKELLRSRRLLTFIVQVGQYLPDWRKGADYTASYSASKAEGGGVLLDLSHEVDYMQWLCGKATELKAINKKISGLEIDSDDFASVIGLAGDGVVFNLTMDYLSREPKRIIHVQCLESTLYCDLIGNTLYEVSEGGERKDFRFEAPERNTSYREMHTDILGDGGCAATLQSGMEVMETIGRIRESSLGDWHG